MIRFESNGEAARALKSIQRNWWAYTVEHHRRAALITDKLPHVSAKPLAFPSPIPKAPLGSWTLFDRNTMIAAADCSSPFPNGQVTFLEDRDGPPSRAYLKLWEAFTLLGRMPGRAIIALTWAPVLAVGLGCYKDWAPTSWRWTRHRSRQGWQDFRA